MYRFAARRAVKILAWTVGGIVSFPVLYLLAALLLGTIPANPGWEEAKQGVTIYLRTNGVHTWIMVPSVTPEMDWRPLTPASHLRDPAQGGDHVAIGYGNRTFYLETPTWGDLTMKNAFLAAFGSGRSLMHADHDLAPRPNEYQRPLVLSHDEYARLVAFMQASFQRDAQGRTIPLLGRGYAANDMFYEGGRALQRLLDLQRWTGGRFAEPGVRTGRWTPLSQSHHVADWN